MGEGSVTEAAVGELDKACRGESWWAVERNLDFI